MVQFQLPEISEGVEAADIAEILINVGDTISAGDIVFAVETEKAIAEIPCQQSGVVTKIHVSPGDTVNIGDVLLSIDESATEGDKQPEPVQTAEKTKSRATEISEPTQKTQIEPPLNPQPQTRNTAKNHFQLAVLGGGPGGYPAAFEAADQGMNVVLIDDAILPGGVCLHRGCIPSKALLHVSKLIYEAKAAKTIGISYETPQIDLNQLRQFKSSVIEKLTGGIAQLAKTRNVELIRARGTFLNSSELELTREDGSKESLSFDNAIIATGSTPNMPKIFNIGDSRVMDSTGALELKDIPERLLVIGGGYIGLEMGTVYSALGTQVTVVEMTPGLLPGADRDLVNPLKRHLTEQFHAIHLNTKVLSLKSTPQGIVAELQGEGVEPNQTFDRVLVSVGRRPNSSNIGLENTRVELDNHNFIKVNEKLETTDPNLLAIGDVAGEPMLAHKATREGRVAVEALVGEPAINDFIAIPAVVFTDPELAWVGLTETEAKEKGVPIKVSRFPWAASGRAQTLARTEGLTKLIVDPETNRLLGMGIVGAGAGELIAEGTLAIENALLAEELARTIHAHPTLSETVMESAESTFGQATHMYRSPRK